MIDVESYARDLEAYLCRKNDGHLIRITGPAFEQVQGWAGQGVPIKVAEAGIDRYFERYYRKGPRRRPVRIEFCEADVLDAFDDWRRAVGVARVVPDSAGGPDVEEPAARDSAAAIARVADRWRAGATDGLARQRPGRADSWASRSTRRCAASMRCVPTRRGRAARRATSSCGAIASIEDELAAAAVSALEPAERSALEREADAELEPFRARMPAEAYRQSRRQALQRLVRHHFGLPSF